ncbi:MAG: hypothetical protein QW767_04300 [Thermoprotei archaeon]
MAAKPVDPLYQLTETMTLQRGMTYAVYGDQASGKTAFCALAGLHAAASGVKTLYVSTQPQSTTALISRLCEALNEPRTILENISVMDERVQPNVSAVLVAAQGTYGTIIYDSVTVQYRQFIAENPDLALSRNKLLLRTLAELHSIRNRFGCTLIYTSTYGSQPLGKPTAITALNYFSDVLIMLKRVGANTYHAEVRIPYSGSAFRYSYSMDAFGFKKMSCERAG